jgi:hypothetical protein
MASLLDLGPLTEEIDIRGVKLKVQGLSAAHLFKLFSEFPDMTQMIGQMGNAGAAMLNMAPDLIAKIIATATGSPDDKQIEEQAKTLGAADQMAILMAVQRLSFPQGFGPFVDQITKLMGTSSLMPSIPSGNTDESGTNSREPSSASLQTESPGLMRGTSPRVN